MYYQDTTRYDVHMYSEWSLSIASTTLLGPDHRRCVHFRGSFVHFSMQLARSMKPQKTYLLCNYPDIGSYLLFRGITREEM